jgi:RNase P/RNase MRP subunit p30
MIGGYYTGAVIKDVVYRSSKAFSSPAHFPCLLVSDSVESHQSADLVTISNFRRAKAPLKKIVKEGLGIEFLLHRARKMNGQELAKWFTELREAYAFCESSGCQFILSSGASFPVEMVSGRSFDEILAELGIDSRGHWRGMENWLGGVLAQKVIAK